MSRPIEFGKPHSTGDIAAGDGARRDAGAGEARGEILDARRRHHAAAGVQQQQIARDSPPGSADRRAG